MDALGEWFWERKTPTFGCCVNNSSEWSYPLRRPGVIRLPSKERSSHHSGPRTKFQSGQAAAFVAAAAAASSWGCANALLSIDAHDW